MDFSLLLNAYNRTPPILTAAPYVIIAWGLMVIWWRYWRSGAMVFLSMSFLVGAAPYVVLQFAETGFTVNYARLLFRLAANIQSVSVLCFLVWGRFKYIPFLRQLKGEMGE